MAPENVLDVLTVKRSDNRPTLEMTIDEINEARNQPTDDAAWSSYDASEFEDATRIELHMDYWDEDEEQLLRMVDGEVATWDSSSETVSVQVDRSATDRVGEYYFEWVLIYDTDAPPSDEADEVNTVPTVGFYNLSATAPTDRNLGEAGPVDRTVGTLTVEETIQDPDGYPPLLPGRTPQEDNHAVHKQYVRNEISGHDHSGSAINPDAVHTGQLLIPPEDLSTVDGDDDALYLHDGTNDITLADGSTTSNTGYYRWDEGASGWRQIGLDADTVDGYHADQLAKVAGETFTGPIRVDTDGEDATVDLLTDTDSQYYPTLHLGSDQDNGIRTQHEPDTGMGRIGTADAGSFTSIIDLDPSAAHASMQNVLEMDVGPEADTFETPLRIFRAGSPVGWLDNSGTDVRLKSASTSSAKLINNNNNGVEITPGDKISFGGTDVGDMPKYSDDTAPPNDTIFYDTSDAQLEYNDPDGTNHVLG